MSLSSKEKKEFLGIRNAVESAGEIFIEGFSNRSASNDGVVEKAHPMDIVTLYDKKIDIYLKEELLKIFPSLDYIGEEVWEEMGVDERENIDFNNVIIVDPIDGTSGFFKQIPICAISVAVVIGGVEKYAVVLNPVSRQLYYAIKGYGAWTSVCGSDDCRIDSEAFDEKLDFRMAYGEKSGSPKSEEYNILKKRLIESDKVRMMSFGSCVLESVYVANQSLGGYLNSGTAIWDVSAVKIILGEVGIEMYDLAEFPGKLVEIKLDKVEHYAFVCYNKKSFNFINKLYSVDKLV